jgi:hypothetical protein
MTNVLCQGVKIVCRKGQKISHCCPLMLDTQSLTFSHET